MARASDTRKKHELLRQKKWQIVQSETAKRGQNAENYRK
jgi:hypothetical protein